MIEPDLLSRAYNMAKYEEAHGPSFTPEELALQPKSRVVSHVLGKAPYIVTSNKAIEEREKEIHLAEEAIKKARWNDSGEPIITNELPDLELLEGYEISDAHIDSAIDLALNSAKRENGGIHYGSSSRRNYDHTVSYVSMVILDNFRRYSDNPSELEEYTQKLRELVRRHMSLNRVTSGFRSKTQKELFGELILPHDKVEGEERRQKALEALTTFSLPFRKLVLTIAQLSVYFAQGLNVTDMADEPISSLVNPSNQIRLPSGEILHILPEEA